MQVNTLLKRALIVLPLLTLAACSSTSETGSASSETGMLDGSSANGSLGGQANGVQLGGAGEMLSVDEQQRQQLEALQRDNVIYFPYDGYDIQGQYAQLLEQHATYLRAHPAVRVLIEGHADERGTPEYNIALGERRAKAVAKFLQTLGVTPEQLSIVSYGEEKPLDLTHGEAAFVKNRRGVLVY
ncbi:MAG: peptidoglycan-associated lipoprotein Pal [Aeromonas sp.]